MSEGIVETQADFPATLDLTSADTRGNFMEAGWKDAIVSAVEMIETKNPEGNLPMGTSGLKVQFTLDGGPYDNRKVWNNYWFPTAEYDTEKRNRSLGMFVRFLGALGYDMNEIKSKGFDLSNIEELVGKECMVNTRYDEDYDNNKCTGVKARGAGSTATTGSGVL